MTTSLTQAESLLRHMTPAEQDSYYIEKAKIFVKMGKRQAAQDLFVCVLKSNNNLANSAIVSTIIKIWIEFNFKTAFEMGVFLHHSDHFYVELSQALPFDQGCICAAVIRDESYKLQALSGLYVRGMGPEHQNPLIAILSLAPAKAGWSIAVKVELNKLYSSTHEVHQTNILKAFKRRNELLSHFDELLSFFTNPRIQTQFIAEVALLDFDRALAAGGNCYYFISLLPTNLVIRNFERLKVVMDQEKDIYLRARGLYALARHLIYDLKDPTALLSEAKKLVPAHSTQEKILYDEEFELELIWNPETASLKHNKDRNRMFEIAKQMKLINPLLSEKWFTAYATSCDIDEDGKCVTKIDPSYVRVVASNTYDMPSYFISLVQNLDTDARDDALLRAVTCLGLTNISQVYVGMIVKPFMKARAYLHLWSLE